MTQLPALLTIEEAADALRIHPETFRRWVRDGKVQPADLPGRTIRIRRTDVERMIGEPAEDGAA